MLEAITSFSLFLAQTASEKKLTVMYILLFLLFLVLLFVDARTKKEVTGPKAVKNLIIILMFIIIISCIRELI